MSADLSEFRHRFGADVGMPCPTYGCDGAVAMDGWDLRCERCRAGEVDRLFAAGEVREDE